MSRYDIFGNTNKSNFNPQNDDRLFDLEFDVPNNFWILPVGDVNPKSNAYEIFCYPFPIHKKIIPGTNKIEWMFCLKFLYGKNVDCPYCKKSFELWDSGIKENQEFAGEYITRKFKYLMNVVPCNKQEVKMFLSDTRVVGKPPRIRNGEMEKIFIPTGSLMNFHLAVDKEENDKTGRDVFLCPNIIGKNATYVTVYRTKPEKSRFEHFSVALPAEKNQKPLPNFETFLNDRYDLAAFSKEVTKTLTYDEMTVELEKILNHDFKTERQNDAEEDTVEETVAEPIVEQKKPAVNEEHPGCFGNYGKLPKNVCDRMCKEDAQKACGEATK